MCLVDRFDRDREAPTRRGNQHGLADTTTDEYASKGRFTRDQAGTRLRLGRGDDHVRLTRSVAIADDDCRANPYEFGRHASPTYHASSRPALVERSYGTPLGTVHAAAPGRRHVTAGAIHNGPGQPTRPVL